MNSERPAGRRWANFYRYHDAVLASDLSHAELRVALVIARCANADGLAWPALATIQERSGRGRSTVLEAIKALEVNGWLTVERQGARARFLGEGNRYRLHLAAEQVPPAGPARANDEAPPQVREPGPDGTPSSGAHQVQESGPDDQVQDPGLLRSRIAQPSGPGSPVFASPAPLSVKEPSEGTREGTTARGPAAAVERGAPPAAPETGAPPRTPFSSEVVAGILFRTAADAKRPVPKGRTTDRAVQALLEMAQVERHPAASVWATVRRWAQTGAPLSFMANDPGQYLAASRASSDANAGWPPAWVRELDSPGTIERERSERERSERERARAEAERWRPRTLQEHETQLATEAWLASERTGSEVFAAARPVRAPEVAPWIAERERMKAAGHLAAEQVPPAGPARANDEAPRASGPDAPPLPVRERVRALLLDAYRSAHEAELHTAWPGPVPDDEPSVEVIVDWCAVQRVPLEAARAVVEGAFKFDAWRRYGWPWSRIAADPGHCAALSTRSLAGQLGEGDERPAHELIPKVDVTTPLTEEERRLSW